MSEPNHHLSHGDEADLAALADGRLDHERREALELRLAADPMLAEALDRQHAAVRTISEAVASVSAPMGLRTTIERMEAEHAAPRRRRRFSLRAWVPMAGLAAAAAAVLIVLVVGGGPAVDDVLAAASRPPQHQVPPDPAHDKLLSKQVDGVTFPNYAGKFGWSAAGGRNDDVDGRGTGTVFYTHGGQKIAYSIVSGDALDWPKDSRMVVYEGVRLHLSSDGDRSVVTWLRQGRTCVLSGTTTDTETLIELAAWKGLGQVEF
jgi:anti-sigma factor RsiW